MIRKEPKKTKKKLLLDPRLWRVLLFPFQKAEYEMISAAQWLENSLRSALNWIPTPYSITLLPLLFCSLQQPTTSELLLFFLSPTEPTTTKTKNQNQNTDTHTHLHLKQAYYHYHYHIILFVTGVPCCSGDIHLFATIFWGYLVSLSQLFSFYWFLQSLFLVLWLLDKCFFKPEWRSPFEQYHENQISM